MSEHPNGHHHHQIHVPRGALIAAGLLILVALGAVATFRIAGLEPAAQIPDIDKTIASRQLRFADSDNGGVLVYEWLDGANDRLIHEVPSGEGGFIRGILRSMARARRASGIGPDHPFVLRLQANGTVLLEDPQTDVLIDLYAFGPTNIDSFRTLFENDPVPQ
ncbi:phosphonate-binding protein [Wenzhouxiangella sp. XN79A]|uniref:photosynthetic complex assembly protein PuhC n=1 Tax=Wenzhouxiangella sp. XN79A TaxID=2724193 RepID=UPI00144ACB2D|nr:photosynthetic complex assembly protein PuhC [Wenzhouxiangella sp. XN79A]NKI34864.1 phosphonate-binding protein [Wenzhouxiangella sp. XN79A]